MTVISWMTYAFTISLLLAGAAWVMDVTLARAAIPTRWIWVSTLLLGLAIPAVAPLRAPRPAAPGIPAVLLGDGSSNGSAALPRDAVGSAAIASIPRFIHRSLDGLNRRLVLSDAIQNAVRLTWIAWSLLLALMVGTSAMRLARRVRDAPRHELRGRLVRVTDNTGPATIGLLDPQIVVPSWVSRFPAEDLELILKHEEEHALARDPLLLASALLLVLATPWNPVAWWQRRRLRDAVEMDCDRRVLKRGAPASHYGDLLFRLGSAAARWSPATAIAGPIPLLERRLSAMRGPRATQRRVWAAVLAALVVVAIACGTEPPQAAGESAVARELGAVPQSKRVGLTVRERGLLEVRWANEAAVEVQLEAFDSLWRSKLASGVPELVVATVAAPDADLRQLQLLFDALRESAPDITIAVRTSGGSASAETQSREELVARLRAALEEIETQGEVRVEALEAIPSAQTSAELRAILADLIEARGQLRELRGRYNDDYPPIRQLSSDIETMETRAIPRALRGIIAELEQRS